MLWASPQNLLVIQSAAASSSAFCIILILVATGLYTPFLPFDVSNERTTYRENNSLALTHFLAAHVPVLVVLSLSLSLQLIYGFFLSHCTSTKKMRVFSLVVFHSPRFGAFSLVKKLDNRTQQTNKQNRQHQYRQAVHIFFCITSLCVRACVCLYDIAKGCI